MIKSTTASMLAAAALLSGTAAFATTKPHAAKAHATKTVKTTKVKTPAK